jgi:hypothetical protein
MKLVGWILVVGEGEEGVFKSQQGAWVDVQGKMKVNGPTTALFGMKVHFPCLTKRIGLDEVSLIVHVKAVVDSVVFKIGDKTGDVNSCHYLARIVPFTDTVET